MKDSYLKELFDKALEAGRNRDYRQAIELLKEVLVRSDQFPEALLYLGRAYHATAEFNRAVQTLQFFLKIHPASSEGHFFIGRAYFALGLFGHALRHLRKSTDLESRFIPALGLLGLTLLKLGRPKTAIAVFERALHLEPDNTNIFTGYLNALLTYGIRLFYHHQYEEARDTLLFIRKHRPDSLVTHVFLASIYRELREPNHSLFHFHEASHLAPQDPVLYLQKAVIHLQMGNNPAAYQEMARAMDLLGGESISVQDAQGLLRLMTVVLFQNQRHREALECARRVLRRSYQDADMHAIMAECFSKLGELGKAKNHYLRALEQKRDRLEFNYGLAAVLWEREEYKELKVLLDRILKSHPEDEFALYYQALSLPFLNVSFEQTIPVLQEQIRRSGPDPHLMHTLGQEYLRADLPELAEGWFRRTLSRIENHEQALLRLIEVYLKLDQKNNLQKAYSEYLRHYPGSLGIRKDFVNFLYDRGSLTRACGEIEKILPYEPKNRRFRKMLAHGYRETGKYAEAILLYRELLLETPKSPELLRPLVFCLEKTGSRNTVILLLEKAVKLFKEDPWILLRLGGLYMQEMELEKAAGAFRNLLSVSPNDWRAHKNLGTLYRRMGNNQFAERFLKRAEELKKVAPQNS
jgi:tetratricopeptide (TPR) repeat protein